MATSTGTGNTGLEDIRFKARRSNPQDVRLLAALLDAHRRASDAVRRGKAGDCLATLADDDTPVPLRIRLRELQKHLATAAQNQQHKIELFEKRSLPSI